MERLGVRLLITRAFAVDVSFDRERRELSEVESQPTESGPGRLVFKTTGFSLMSKIVSFCWLFIFIQLNYTLVFKANFAY